MSISNKMYLTKYCRNRSANKKLMLKYRTM